MTENTSTPETRLVKTPPLLLGATLLFWGWQSDLLMAGAVMGIILESARVVKARWDLSETDFRRMTTFCLMLGFTMAIYAFTTNEEGGSLGGLFRGAAAVHNASVTSVRTATAWLRWLPMMLFLVVAAQSFSAIEAVPSTALSLVLRRRRQQQLKRDGHAPPVRLVNVSYAYFMVCIFSASIHANPVEGGTSYFWGQGALIVWALWPFRARRFTVFIWALALAAVVGLGFASQRGIMGLGRLIQNAEPRFFARFLRLRADPMHSTTAMGQIGELKLSGRIIIRLQTEPGQAPPTYLREASYRTYHSPKQSWYAGTPHSDFSAITPLTNETTWVLLPGKTNPASVNIACYLYGGKALLPLPTGSGRLENLNAYILQKNSEGAVLAEGPGLVIFDALYGPGATMDVAPDNQSAETNLDLAVPTNEVPALDRVIAELKLSGTDEPKTLQAISGFFENKFTYSLWQGPDKAAMTNETPLSRFLLTSRSGHCEYFATATVLLLRELKIPARYAVGYAVHEGSGGGYVVRERDAHAWCLVWNNETKTWENFDTTPASWVAEESKRASAMQWFSDFWSWVGFQIAKFRWGQTQLRGYVFLALIPVLALLLYQIIFRRGRQRRRQQRGRKGDLATSWPGLDSEFYQLEKKLAERGVARLPSEPLSDWLSRALAEPALIDLQTPLQELLRLHYRYRFDPNGLDDPEREALRQEAVRCLQMLADAKRNRAG